MIGRFRVGISALEGKLDRRLRGSDLGRRSFIEVTAILVQSGM
jgi:hypothetical protein